MTEVSADVGGAIQADSRTKHLVRAHLVPPDDYAPSWSPWQMYMHDGLLSAYDVGRGGWDSFEFDISRLSLMTRDRNSQPSEPWEQCIPPECRAIAMSRLKTLGSDARVGAFDARGDRWVLAVNDRTDSSECRLIIGGRVNAEIVELSFKEFRSIAGVSLCNDQALVVVDNYRHIVARVGIDGIPQWIHGRALEPGVGEGRLFSPSDCVIIEDRVVVTNEMSGAITLLSLSTGAEIGSNLLSPHSTPTGIIAFGGLIIISDAHRGEMSVVEEVDGAWRRIPLQTPRPSSVVGNLSFPRSIVRDGGHLAIADTANGRVVWLTSAGDIHHSLETGGWPRSLLATTDGLLVADGLGSRILRVVSAQDFEVVSLRSSTEPVTIEDPHHLEGDDDDFWLVDSARNDLFKFDSIGELRMNWASSAAGVEHKLDDPHQILVDGDDLLVVDTNNDRVLRASKDLQKCAVVASGLSRPRFLVKSPGGWIVSDHRGLLHLYDEAWIHRHALVICPEDSKDYVNFSDPPRAMFSESGLLHVVDWERGVVYTAPIPDVDHVILDDTSESDT